MPRLLLADDSVTIQRVIELTFADEAIEVVSVGDGRAAIEQIQQQPPDIVLADIGMPERDGYEVAAFVKGTPEFSSIPVLLLTGAFEPIDEERARAVGCDGVLVKPFEPQMVISRVRDLLGGRRPDGMWSAPAPQSPLRQSAPVADAQLSVASAAPGAGLEDYFDRLDAAFASLESGEMKLSSLPPSPQAAPARAQTSDSHDLAEDLAAWTMQEDVESPPAQPVESPSSTMWEHEHGQGAAEPASEPQPAAHVQAPDAPATAPPTLAEAFAALLAAEQSQPFAPAALSPAPVPVVQAAPPPQPVPEHVVEAIVERVVARMTEQAVRQTVLDVAERVVREEIDRIKASHP